MKESLFPPYRPSPHTPQVGHQLREQLVVDRRQKLVRASMCLIQHPIPGATINCHNPTQSWVASTQQNSTKFSMQPHFNPTRRFMQKRLGPPDPPTPPPPKNPPPKFSKFDFEPIIKKTIFDTNLTPHPPPPHRPTPPFLFNQIQYATSFQPHLEDSCTEQLSVLFNPNQIQYKTKTIQSVVAQLRVT